MSSNSAGPTRGQADGPPESAVAHQAYLTYRDMGPSRSLRKLAQRLGKCESLLKRWSARHSWRERVMEWDRQHQEEANHQARCAVEAAYERRLAHAEQLERVAMAGLRSLMVRDAETGEVRFDRRLKPTEIAALIRVACRLLPTSVPEAPSGAEEDAAPEELARLTSEDVEMLLSLLENQAEDDTEAEEDADEDAD